MTQEDRLGGRIGYRLTQTRSALHTRIDQALRPYGLDAQQYTLLDLLRRAPGASNADLAREAHLTRQSINAVLRSLQERGLVYRTVTVGTGHALPTELTSSGRRILDDADAAVHRIEAKMVTKLTVAQQRGLDHALVLCMEALDE